MIVSLLRAAILTACLLSAGSAFAGTFYISKSTGSDTNTSAQAQAKSTPWAHLPGMPSCTSNCASYTPVAGDRFILMGCDTWVPSDFFVAWDWSGASGNPIYIGVDKTWYNATACPSGWNRPIFDGQNTSANEFFRASADRSSSWVTLDNIEMKRMNGCTNFLAYNATTHWTLSNMYVHAWHVPTDDNAGVVKFQAGNLFTTGVIDGSDSSPTPGVTCNVFYSTPPDVTNSVIHDMPNAIVGYAGGLSGGSTCTWAGNNIYNINDSNGGSHGNAIETVGAGTYYIYNNLIHHMGNCPGCESMFIGNSGETDYVFNNVIWDLGASGNAAQTPSVGGESNGHTYFWNNTIVSPATQPCINNGSQGAVGADVTVQNIHCISVSSGSVSDFTFSNSLLQTTAQAAANTSPHFDQYTSAQVNVYSPVATTNSTVGAGANLSSNCSGLAAGLCSDASFYMQQTINGVVQAVPARAAVSRPSSGAWNLGAYHFPGTTVQAPQPPANLQAAVQ